MSFKVDARKGRVKAALRRAAAARIDKALAEIDRHGPDASTHELRKRVKELRGLLRLIRPGFEDFAQVNSRLRDAGDALAPARDAEVMLRTLDALCATMRAPERFARLRACLLAEVARRRAEAGSTAIDDYRATFVALRAEAADWKIKGRGKAVIWQGLAASWEQAQRRMARAQAALAGDFDAVPFHDWRKPVKHHWYHARMLAPIRRRDMAAHIALVDDLGEMLGHHNDLDVLIRFLRAHTVPRDEDALALMEGHVIIARRGYATAALHAGAALFGEPAEALVARWRGWAARGKR